MGHVEAVSRESSKGDFEKEKGLSPHQIRNNLI